MCHLISHLKWNTLTDNDKQKNDQCQSTVVFTIETLLVLHMKFVSGSKSKRKQAKKQAKSKNIER